MQAGFKPESTDTSGDALRAGRDALRREALGLMTAGMAHDLERMIQVLASATRDLDRRLDPHTAEGLQPLAAAAVRSLNRAAALIRLFAGARRTDGAGVEDLDVALCLAALEPLLHCMAGETIRVDLRVSPACPRLACRPRDFETVLLHLLLNARDAMPDGGILTIDAADRDDAGPSRRVVLSVTDTGSGMDDQTLARAFEPFFTTKGGDRGEGLGLAMVRRFAQAAGGGATACSAPRAGTTVTLDLPGVTRPCASE
jgi:signal transduction histidine kinase